MTSLGDLVLASPHLPSRPSVAVRSVVTSIALHVLALSLGLAIVGPGPRQAAVPSLDADDAETITLPRMVFLAEPRPGGGGGGGGGGNRQSAPIRHAESIGHDPSTVRIAPPRDAPLAVTVSENAVPLPEPPPPSAGLVLDAQPLASGTIDQIGRPDGGVAYGTSQGPGSGGGVGSGVGTGIGSGEGPGFGPGSGGGTGGGAYRPGGSVTSPRLLTQVQPVYTSDALKLHIQGSVVLETIVTKEGLPSALRVVRSLDPGLDEEAVKAVRQWRFAPGRLANGAVDVLIVIAIDFAIR